jgi:RNA polymerase sigma factor (sigma-70 family)
MADEVDNPARRNWHSPVLRSFLRHESFLKRFIRRYLPQQEDVDEVMQESFLRAYTAECSRPIERPKSFLFQIARNEALDRLRRKSHQITDYIDDLASLDVPEDGPGVDEQVEHRQRVALFCEAVATLPVQCRKAFLLRKVYGLSHREVADELGIAVSTVEKHQATALQRCSQFVLDRQRVSTSNEVTNCDQPPVVARRR